MAVYGFEPPLLIGLCGRARSGKDTVGKMILSQAGGIGNAKTMAFADPMKKFCAELFYFSDEQLHGAAKEVEDPRYPGLTPRHALQTLGTEWGRACDPEIWIKYAMCKAREARQEGFSVIITDVRFLNEAAAITKEGGFIIKIDRPDLPEVGIAGHQSETELAAIRPTYGLINNGTLEDLRCGTASVLEAIRNLARAGGR